MKNLIIILIMTLSFNSVSAQSYKSVNEAKGLSIGDQAPEFMAVDKDGNNYSLHHKLKNGPVVLIFYRGFWCPYCNKHLSSVQDSLQLIYDKGASVVAVSPEKPEYLQKMADRTGADFTLLYDEGYRISDAYDVTFRPDSITLFKYNTMLHTLLKKSHSDESERLPIPATYVIDRDGKIIWRQFDPDYKNRSTVSEIIDALSK